MATLIKNSISSMTGMGSSSGQILDHQNQLLLNYKIEIKSLNHRFLDLKLRLPREFVGFEYSLKQWLQSKISRGSVEFKIEKADSQSTHKHLEPNLLLAKSYYDSLLKIQSHLGLKDIIQTADIAHYPEVLNTGSTDLSTDEVYQSLLNTSEKALEQFFRMRQEEGKRLKVYFLNTLKELEESLLRLKHKREASLTPLKEKAREKILKIMELYPLESIGALNTQTLLENKLSQELLFIIEKTDIQEELTRFESHLVQFKKMIESKDAVGKKCEFILQELGREINTMGNKAQDFGMSEETISIKVKLEQMREQVMNLE